MNVADGTYTDLTQDDLTGSWQTFVSKGTQPNLDYLPAWNEKDGAIYFWRVAPLGNQQYKVSLQRIEATGGQPTQVADLSTALPKQIPFFYYQTVALDGSSAIAPDGGKLAVLMASLNDMGAAQYSLYMVDLANPSAAPQFGCGSNGMGSCGANLAGYANQSLGSFLVARQQRSGRRSLQSEYMDTIYGLLLYRRCVQQDDAGNRL